MNFIFIILFFVVFYLIYLQRKNILKEKIKKQITDSLNLGIMKYCKFQINDIGFLINNDNQKESDSIKKIKEMFSDYALSEVNFYKFLVESFESYFTEEEYDKFLIKFGKNFDIFIDKPSLAGSKLYICDEPIRKLYLSVVLISLYKNEKTKDRSILMLNSVPLEVKENVLRVVNFPKFKELIN